MDKGELESVIVDPSSMEESESKCFHKIINEEKYANNETEHEETLVTDNTFVNEPSYLNLSECSRNISKRLDATWEQACMA